MSDSSRTSNDIRRWLVLLFAIVLLAIYAATTIWPEFVASSEFFAAASGRVGLVLGALWLAWPSLQKPARWLPPGVAVLIVGALVVLAARPRLAVVVVPAFGALMALATVIRIVKGK